MKSHQLFGGFFFEGVNSCLSIFVRMTAKDISFIIPVFNRPDEIKELLESFLLLEGDHKFEIVIIEDGSTITSHSIILQYSQHLDISYHTKVNSGPGDSRNVGMRMAKGSFFIILDSDCLLPTHYLNTVLQHLTVSQIDCFGGPDAAHSSFSPIQKAINFSLTSFISTGGIRGKHRSVNTFQPRSFNMGLSKKAFEATSGFGNIHPGEDPDLSIRLNKLGFKTVLISKAYVYHKRRISLTKFYHQVYKFGLVRPILNTWHPHTRSITYWFPTLFSLGSVLAIILAVNAVYWPVFLLGVYFLTAFFMAFNATKNIIVSLLSLVAIGIQFFGYGKGFLKSTVRLMSSNYNIEARFPELFFKAT